MMLSFFDCSKMGLQKGTESTSVKGSIMKEWTWTVADCHNVNEWMDTMV